MNHFKKQWKGQRVLLTVRVYPEGPSELLKGYYRNKIIPDFQKIFRVQEGDHLSYQSTEEKLRKISPICEELLPEEETNGHALVRIREIDELSSSEFVEHIEHLKRIASIQYHTFIHDPLR